MRPVFWFRSGFRLLCLLAFMLSMLAPALAVRPDEMLKDPALEARARAVSSELRCLVCQNQSIDDSDADLAHDLRVLVRDRITAGDSDAAVKDYLVQRYGDFILLRPRFTLGNALLWAAGPIAFLGGLIAIWFTTKGSRERKDRPLSESEEARIEAIIARSFRDH
jgi:cytochrome c-type biogenesis protein CcmH